MAHTDLSISATVQYPDAPYLDIKRAILGTAYQVSLTFVGETRARRYNQTYRGKSYVPNVLSFPLETKAGEIVICPVAARREAKAHELSFTGYITYLFIHGLLHLKGYDHGATMDRLEARFRRQFSVK
jgi:probable rRNA maturation factor